MHKGKLLTSITVLLSSAVIALSGYAVYSAGAATKSSEPGSSSDPLVTKSFVEKYVAEAISDYIDEYAKTNPGASAWEVKVLQPGDIFVGESGTDFIVRTGKAIIIDPNGSGIPDLTAGSSGMQGTVAEKNHLYSLPRSDGRGIAAETLTTVMFRGTEVEY